MPCILAPIDRYFGEQLGRLGWRTVDFVHEVHGAEFQGCAVMNYADEDVPWTRISRVQAFCCRWHGELAKTVTHADLARLAGNADEPYYPINLAEDRARFDGYRALAAE